MVGEQLGRRKQNSINQHNCWLIRSSLIGDPPDGILWSDRAEKDQIHRLLVDLAEIKESLRETNQLSIDFPSLANKFLEKFYITFIEQENIYSCNGYGHTKNFYR